MISKTLFPAVLGIVPFFIAAFLLPGYRFGITSVVLANVPRKISILNESGHRVEVFWINPNRSELVKQSESPIHNRSTFLLNSFVGHSFQVNEVPRKKSGVCGSAKGAECRTAYFTVNENNDQALYITEEFEVNHKDHKSIAREGAGDMLSLCREKQMEHILSAPANKDVATEAMNALVECVESNIAEKFEKFNEEIAFEVSVRNKMADLLENYTCADELLPETEPLRSESWIHTGDDHNVRVMHERKNSKIHVIDNFIKPEECEAIEKSARKGLHSATVADDDGGSRLSESRKAKQAGIKVPWNEEQKGNPIAVLSRRVYDYTNSVTGYDLNEDGQEDLMSIQYFGRGEGDKAPDRYMPHCDGDCVGLPHKYGTRVATIVMYCVIPEKGGATNFRQANIHVVPKPGNAVFFSYMGPDDVMDNGFTEHSGCPVIKGEKKIVTQWMRKGVDKENPWDSFNTLGVKLSEIDEE